MSTAYRLALNKLVDKKVLGFVGYPQWDKSVQGSAGIRYNQALCDHLKTEGSMIDHQTLQRIRELTLKFWMIEATTATFRQLATGKEIGHRIADLVDETTTSLIEKSFQTARQRNRSGDPMPRSMGDIWVLSNGMYNPINIKAGEADKNGQPNMVSLNKLVNALLHRQIDSYYLLFVKMKIIESGILPVVYLVDILEYLNYVTFDSGPGQIMLKEKQFYDAMESGTSQNLLSIAEKLDTLIYLAEDAHRRLMQNRERRMARLKKKRSTFSVNEGQGIDQSGLNLR